MATLFVMLGDPGSGKTYFSERIAEKEMAVHLCADRIRNAMVSQPTYSLEEHGAVFRTMNLLAGECLSRGVSVVFDANNNRQHFRKPLMDLSEQKGAEYLLVQVKVPLEVALERIQTRGDGVDPAFPRIEAEVLLKIRRESEGAMPGEPFVEVSGLEEVEAQMAGIRDEIKMGAEPDLEFLHQDRGL